MAFLWMPINSLEGQGFLLTDETHKGTAINDVPRFSAIFDLPTHHVRQFLPYNVRYFGAFLDPYLP